MLVQKYREARGDGTDREVETLAKIQRAVDSSLTLRNKKDLILAFVDSVSVDSDVNEDWRRFVEARRDEELEQIIADEGLKPDETRAFVESAFRDGAIPTTGTAITKILPPVSRFSADDSHGIKKQPVLDSSQRSSTGTSGWVEFSDRSRRVRQTRPVSCVQLPREECRVRG